MEEIKTITPQEAVEQIAGEIKGKPEREEERETDSHGAER